MDIQKILSKKFGQTGNLLFAQRKIFMFDGRVVDEETMHRLRHEEEQRLFGSRQRTGAHA